MSDPIARYPFKGNSNYSITLPNTASYLVLFNDGNSDLTFNAGTFTGVIRPGGAFDERLDPFTKLQIVASSNFNGYCRVSVGGVG